MPREPRPWPAARGLVYNRLTDTFRTTAEVIGSLPGTHGLAFNTYRYHLRVLLKLGIAERITVETDGDDYSCFRLTPRGEIHVTSTK